MNKVIIKIKEDQINGRIDKILADFHKVKSLEITRGRVQELIGNGFLTKNNEVFKDNSYRAKLNDELILNIPEFEDDVLKPASIPLNIIYEDNDLIVINKQAGLTTHPGAGNDEDTLANALLGIYGDNLSKVGGEFRPGIVHRLDKDTSGLMVVAKNDEAHLKLSEQLQNRELKRTYIGFLWGVLNPRNGHIEGYMERSKTNRLKMEMVADGRGRFSLTNYKTLTSFAGKSISLSEFNLDTGRTHQIRVHCSYMGCPLVGDHVYGGNSRHLKKEYQQKDLVDNFPRQALHSYKISFCQPNTNKLLKFEVPLPEDMQNLLNELEKVEDKI